MIQTTNYPGPSAADIAAMLRANAEQVGRMVFPHAVKAGNFLCVGSILGEPGDSLKIRLTGPKAGTWADYARSEGEPGGVGDMLKLLELTIGGGDLKRAIDEAKRFLSLDTMDPRAIERMRINADRAAKRAAADKANDDERKRRNAEGLWQSAAPLTPASPATLYLAGRGIVFGPDSPLRRPPGSIRFHHAVWHAEKGRKLPAMVTCFVDLTPRTVAVHVTYLEYQAGAGWVKLPDMLIEGKPTKVAKKIWCPLYWGAHLPLWKGDQRDTLARVKPGTPVECAEGIEDGLSYAMANPRARVIGAGTIGNIGKVRLPEQAGAFTVLTQNDTKPEPIAQLEGAIRQQQEQAAAQAGEAGARRLIACRRPPQGVKDWNDWLRGEG